MLPTLLLLGWLGTAQAGPVGAVRSREPLPAREVERGPVLARGWSALSAGWSQRLGTARVLVDRPETFAVWRYRDQALTTTPVGLTHGLTARVAGSLDLAWREHAVDGTQPARARGLGDVRLGLSAVLAERDVGGRWLAGELSFRTPVGNDHPGSDADLPLAAPGSRLRAGLVGRQRIGALRVDLEVAGARDLAGVVGSGVLPERCAGLVGRSTVGALGGGWVGEGSVRALVQAGPLFGTSSLDGQAWTGRILRHGPECRRQAAGRVAKGLDNPGHAVDGTIGVGAQLGRGVELRVEGGGPVAGRSREHWLVERVAGRSLGGALTAWF